MLASRNLVVFAALNGAVAVALGAFAAHGAAPGVKSLLTTGAGYQLTHAVLAAAIGLHGGNSGLIRLAGWLAAAGGLIFALALSLIALLSLAAMGAIAPIGGLLMIGAWLLLAIAAFRTQSSAA